MRSGEECAIDEVVRLVENTDPSTSKEKVLWLTAKSKRGPRGAWGAEVRALRAQGRVFETDVYGSTLFMPIDTTCGPIHGSLNMVGVHQVAQR